MLQKRKKGHKIKAQCWLDDWLRARRAPESEMTKEITDREKKSQGRSAMLVG